MKKTLKEILKILKLVYKIVKQVADIIRAITDGYDSAAFLRFKRGIYYGTEYVK